MSETDVGNAAVVCSLLSPVSFLKGHQAQPPIPSSLLYFQPPSPWPWPKLLTRHRAYNCRRTVNRLSWFIPRVKKKEHVFVCVCVNRLDYASEKLFGKNAVILILILIQNRRLRNNVLWVSLTVCQTNYCTMPGQI